MDVYSESNFWNKVVKYAKIAGKEVIERALQLYYASQDPNLPPWAKTVIFGALAYFIFPVDAIPDLIPGVGYVDDLGVLAAAVVTVALYITEDVKQKARQKLRDWFGDGESV
jgi:uncharacterized membrane protein YkvA (DUF1232 family)